MLSPSVVQPQAHAPSPASLPLQKVLCGFPTWRVLSRGDQNPPKQMQGSSSTTDTDINTKVEDVFTYNSSNSKKARLQSMLSALLSDPILSDVPKKPSIVDVDTLISLELGSAMKISVMKMDNTSFDVAMLNSATVKDLKQAIKNKTEEIEQGQLGHRHISWYKRVIKLLHSCTVNLHT
ncbi:hypothetical protein Taro_007195 [Colocasia esculenta]|uniref:SNRNP25 ubiquitin-like domain-containing protein n=1 Tax=Colocasia esculenta TaxID=4460 RepID=A0A843TQQ8_COLES|nr:hypothetical protein [Colocasia esculenta]